MTAPTQCTCRALSMLTRRVQRMYDNALAPHGLTIGQFSMLTQIRGAPGLSLLELAERNVMDPSTVSRLLRPLAARGLVDIGVDPMDRRARRLSLTEQGAVLQGEGVRGWRQAQAELERNFGKTRAATLHALLGELLTALPD